MTYIFILSCTTTVITECCTMSNTCETVITFSGMLGMKLQVVQKVEMVPPFVVTFNYYPGITLESKFSSIDGKS